MQSAQRMAAFRGKSGLDYWRAYGDYAALKDTLPNLPAAQSDFLKLIRESRKWSEEAGTDEEVSFDAELTNEEKSRLRFGHSWGPQGSFTRFGERWGRGMSLAYVLAPREIRTKLKELFTQLNLYRYRSATKLQTMLKELSNVAKKHGDMLFPGWWKWLINWETLGGYVPASDISEFVDELRQWATGDIVHEMPDDEGNMSEVKFLDCLEDGMWEFLRTVPNLEKANREAMTIAEFVKYPGNWARSGSSKRKEAVLYTDAKGKLVKAKKTKWRTALALPPGVVEKILRETRPGALVQKNAAIQKRETGKRRAVVNSDDETYLRMAYISSWLEVALSGHPRSTLFMTTKQLVDMWEGTARATRDDTVKVPLDQSHFDWQQNKRMINRFMNVIERMIKTYATDKVRGDLLSVANALRVTLVDSIGTLSVGEGADKVVIPIEKGVMSGWRWTALMDTVFNWGELHCAKQLLMENGFTDPIIDAVAQGDDDKVRTPTYGHAAALTLAYGIMNFEVNPGKFFIATDRDEYLRQVAEPGLVSGYPIRGVTSLLWRNPISRDPPAGLLRLGEQVKGWNLVLGRGADRQSVQNLMLRDITQANGISKDEALAILATPATVGGIGWTYSPTAWMSFAPGQVKTKATIAAGTVHGLRRELQTWRRLGRNFSKEEAVQAMADNLDLSRAKKDVIEGSIKSVEPLKPFGWAPAAIEEVYALTARSRVNLPKTLNEYSLTKAIRTKDWDWIRNVWLEPTLRSLSDRIEANGGRTVWVDWLTGKLPWHLPTIPTWSDLVPSIYYNAYVSGAWSRVVGMARFTKTTVKRAALTAEFWTVKSVIRRDIRLGG